VGPLDRTPASHGFVADLPGFARGWGVAMDNRRDLPGYKRYRGPDGARPAVHVCFLDIAPDPAGIVNGVCLPVDDATLAVLDARERNYRRHDVSERIAAGGARIWTYIGTTEGRRRRARAGQAGTAVIAAAYLAGVRAAFAALGPAEARACAASIDPAGLPVLELEREDLPR
jgi:hypothetical protein